MLPVKPCLGPQLARTLSSEDWNNAHAYKRANRVDTPTNRGRCTLKNEPSRRVLHQSVKDDSVCLCPAREAGAAAEGGGKLCVCRL